MKPIALLAVLAGVAICTSVPLHGEDALVERVTAIEARIAELHRSVLALEERANVLAKDSDEVRAVMADARSYLAQLRDAFAMLGKDTPLGAAPPAPEVKFVDPRCLTWMIIADEGEEYLRYDFGARVVGLPAARKLSVMIHIFDHLNRPKKSFGAETGLVRPGEEVRMAGTIKLSAFGNEDIWVRSVGSPSQVGVSFELEGASLGVLTPRHSGR